MRRKRLRQLGFVFLLAAMTLFSIAAGVFVRDLGAGYRGASSGPLDPGDVEAHRFNAYELPYEVAVFSTVRVRITIEALFGDLYLEFESNGSFLTTFRPHLPGAHQVTIVNLEPVRGQVGFTLLLQGAIPPDLEASILDPVLYSTAGLLFASVVLFTMSRVASNRPGEKTDA